MKAKDLITTAEYIASLKKPKRTPREKDHTEVLLKLLLTRDEASVTELLHKKLEEVDAIQKFLKDYEKANKKEDKKPEGWSTFQIATVFLVFAAVAPLYLRMIVGH